MYWYIMYLFLQTFNAFADLKIMFSIFLNMYYANVGQTTKHYLKNSENMIRVGRHVFQYLLRFMKTRVFLQTLLAMNKILWLMNSPLFYLLFLMCVRHWKLSLKKKLYFYSSEITIKLLLMKLLRWMIHEFCGIYDSTLK